ncbi:MAG: regulatory protein GntR, HTH:GntR, C-terminal [Rhodospirillales bacterium]|nr:regulatory protein GntR, HTH:GntR, C-terminal [Rhodospirillales bacterium]
MARAARKPDITEPRAVALSTVVAAIEEDIVLGRLLPRERLVEDDLMVRFEAKRNVVRQALLELERLGTVERVPNRGAQVRSYTAVQVQQLYDVREMLEMNAASLIPLPLNEAALEKLRTIQREHDAAVKSGDLKRVFRANIAFHRALFANCGNRYLSEAINEFAHKAHVIRFHSLTQKRYVKSARDDHWAMIEALATGDRNGLIEICRRHLLPSKTAYLKVAPRLD